MDIKAIPFTVTDWQQVEQTERAGERGIVRQRTRHFGDIRVRLVEYSAGYLADHWCQKGHVIFVLEGELHTELQDGTNVTLTSGMSYQVADGASSHRSRTPTGCRLFVVD
jgi:hypothetical protein